MKTKFTKRLLRILTALISATALTIAGPVSAAIASCKQDAMVVFDASGSMATLRDGRSKIDIAREAAADVIPELAAQRATGLVTYGGMYGASCGGVALRLPPMANSGELILGELSSLHPSGSTPLTDAVALATATLSNTGRPGTIVLVTDGRENCGLNACAMGQEIARKHKHIKVHVIGFYLHSAAEASVSCLASATRGTYTSVHSLEELKDALRKTLGCPHVS